MAPRLFYDERDDAFLERRGSRRLYWLDDLGAVPLSQADPSDEGFLFTCSATIEDYRRIVEPFPRLRDRPEERAPLLDLDRVLDRLAAAGVGRVTGLVAGRARIRIDRRSAGRLGVRVDVSNPILGEFLVYEGEFAEVSFRSD